MTVAGAMRRIWVFGAFAVGVAAVGAVWLGSAAVWPHATAFNDLAKGRTATPGPLASALPPLLNSSTGRTFYVSRAGRDTNSGTRIRPWRTIQKALNTLRPGQRALVGSGTYTENLWMHRAGTAAAPITVAAYPGATVVLHAASAVDDRGDWIPIIIGTGAAYFRLHGFVIENGIGISDANVYVAGSADHIELSGNEIRGGQDQGIFTASTTSYVYIVGNKIHDNGLNHIAGQHQSHGIYLEGEYDVVANNLIYGHRYGFGIQIYPANHDTAVVDNTIVDSGHSSIVVGGTGGVYGITIRNNILYGGDYGLDHDRTCPTGPVAIDHNVISAYKVAPVHSGCSPIDESGGDLRADPLFADYPGRDFHLRPASPAVGRALPEWSEAHDLEGYVRLTDAPDIGALQLRVASPRRRAFR
jgi:hypothetical protein